MAISQQQNRWKCGSFIPMLTDRTPRWLGKLRQVGGAQMGADGTSGIAKAGLPQYGQIG
jgi:hypothetical protein